MPTRLRNHPSARIRLMAELLEEMAPMLDAIPTGRLEFHFSPTRVEPHVGIARPGRKVAG
jgi:hypothetical protein